MSMSRIEWVWAIWASVLFALVKIAYRSSALDVVAGAVIMFVSVILLRQFVKWAKGVKRGDHRR